MTPTAYSWSVPNYSQLFLGDKQDRFSRWARSLEERRGYWRAVVAIAAKNARLAWAVLKFGEDFRLAPSAA